MISKTLLTALPFAALAFGPLPAFAQNTAKPDLSRARQIVEQVCAACHGVDGNSAASANPSLAGQVAEYTTRQLRHFKEGVRVNAVMQGMTAALKPEEMTALGVYFSQQKPTLQTARDATTVVKAQALYRAGDAGSGLPACSSCHAPNGAGLPKNYPRLSGQYADYTYAQLKAFKSGERGADKDGKDSNGKVMSAVAQHMTDAQMKALADYTAGLR